MKSIIKFVLILLIIKLSLEGTESDIVKSLPDYSYRGRLYSGYLQVDSVKQFHYMFNLANQDPDSKPLVLWFNGGPGCSSLDGWSSENGPMQMDEKDGKFYLNEYSWHKAANMLYIESPGNVGFSYIDSQLDYELAIDDDIAAQDNFQALLSFYKKFPSYKGRDFYISGESYAGIYIPTLAYQIIKYNEGVPESQKINLKGILVGNGVADWKYDTSNAMIDFAFSHHLSSYEMRKDYNKWCIMEFDEEKCVAVLEKIDPLLDNVNIYDYLRECDIPFTSDGKINFKSKYFLYSKWAFKNFEKKKKRMSEPQNILKILKSRENRLTVPCVNDQFMYDYFNRKDVKEALHVNMNKEWELCSEDVNSRYRVNYEKGSIWTYPTILKSGVRILIYSGDTDMAVPFNGNQAWINDLKLEVEKPWHQWRAFDDHDNVSGYVTKYKGLTFCTVKGTGHMAPQWKPKESYYMFTKFLNNEDF